MIKVLGAHNTIEKWLSALESTFAFLFTKPSRSTGNYPISEGLVINWIIFYLINRKAEVNSPTRSMGAHWSS